MTSGCSSQSGRAPADLVRPVRRPGKVTVPEAHQLDDEWFNDFRRLLAMDDELLRLVIEGHRLEKIGDRAGARRQLDQADETKERMDLLVLVLRFPIQRRR